MKTVRTMSTERRGRSVLSDVFGIVLEHAGGAPLADGEFSVTLRDLARVGQLCAQGGVVDGRRVVPAAWLRDTRLAYAECRRIFLASPDAPASLCPLAGQACRPRGHYRNHWWVLDPGDAVLLAAGIFGQYPCVDITAGVVLAKPSSLPDPLDFDVSADSLSAFAADPLL